MLDFSEQLYRIAAFTDFGIESLIELVHGSSAGTQNNLTALRPVSDAYLAPPSVRLREATPSAAGVRIATCLVVMPKGRR